jgi:hypothetical protein
MKNAELHNLRCYDSRLKASESRTRPDLKVLLFTELLSGLNGVIVKHHTGE